MTSKDAARYYVGQAFWVKCKDGFEGEGFIESISHTDDIFSPNNIDLFGNEFEDGSIIDFKLILTHPSDMSKRQVSEYKSFCKKIPSSTRKLTVVDTPDSLVYLFERGIDAFDLIDNGYAINKNNRK